MEKVTHLLNQLLAKVEIRVNWKTFPLFGPIQGVQDCTCECPRSQAGTGKSTHVEIRDVGGTFFVSSNGVVQCRTDYSGHVLHARIDRDMYVSDPLHTASDVICPSRLVQC